MMESGLAAVELAFALALMVFSAGARAVLGLAELILDF